MKTMKRMVSKKSHSWWWDSHISPKNSRWLADNLEAMDRLVKEMLKLIEQEGDSFAKKAEMYYQRRPELTTQVENFYRMYRALAERYDHVTGELRRNFPSGLQSQGSAGGSDFGSEPPSPPRSPSPEQRPDSKLSRSKSRARAAGFDFFLGSGGSSDSRKGSDGSSSSESDSETDSDDAKEMMSGDVDPDHLCPRIVQLESELSDVKEKLQQHEQKSDEGLLSRVVELEAELTAANGKLQGAQEVIEQLRQEVEKKVQVEAALVLERKPSSDVEDSIHEKSYLEADTVDGESSVHELKASVERFSQERLLLEAKISEQALAIEKLNDMMASSPHKFSEEKLKLEKDILSLSESHASLKMELALLEDERRQLEVEKAEVCTSSEKRIEELNQSLEALKLKLDMLSSEKEELTAEASALVEDVKRRDDRIREIDVHLQQLHLEHVKLITEAESAQRESKAMNDRIKDLEEEVERQQAVISDGAEKKREAIRQLCFSLEHYRDGYKKLRQVLLDHGRLPTVLAS